MNKNISTSKSFIILSFITIVEKVLSFVYQAMIAGMIGANSISDAFFTAGEFFVLIDSTLLNALVIVLLNNYTKQIADSDLKKADEFLNNVLRIVFPVTVVLSLSIFLLSYPISYIIGPGYDDSGRKILIWNIRYMSIVPVFLSVTSVCLAILRREKKFFIVGLKSLFISTSGMTFVLIAHFTSFSKTNTLCFGYVLAYFLYMITVCVTTRNHNILRIGLPKWGKEENKLVKMLMPLVISNGILKVSMMIDKIICSTVGEGAVSCLTYSHTLYYFVEALFITNLSTVLLSDFNELSAKGLKKEMGDKIARAISTMILLLIPITIITIIYRYDIVRIVFMRGSFKESDVHRVGNLIMIYSIGFVPSVISNIYMQVHYSEGETGITMKYSLISIGINIVTSLLLSKVIGLPGIAIGTVISIIISVTLYKRTIKKFVTDYKVGFTCKKLIRLFTASLVCTIVVYVLNKSITLPLFSFITASTLGLVTFFVILLFMKDSDSTYVIAIVKKRIKNLMQNSKNSI